MTELLPLWGAIGETSVEGQFGDFYRTRLQRTPGHRARSRDVLAAHLDWAQRSGAASVSYKELRRLMTRLGHRHVTSNGVFYTDLTILSDGAAIVLDAARERAGRIASAGLIEQIDRAIAELAELRRLVFEAAQ